MQKLLETVKIVDGQAQYLEFHQARMQRSCVQLNIAKRAPDLKLALLNAPEKGEFRARIVYEQQIESVEYFPILARNFQRFKLVKADDLEYGCKFLNRDAINQLFAEKGAADDVLFVKYGLITDTSIANVAFFDGIQWLTPRVPLLEGTTRARLLQLGELHLTDITPAMLLSFEKMALCNAILEFWVLEGIEIA
ncbi:MAG: aminotransferase class IV [Thiotrichaceae bacterium]|nr:aminotransferase class IV [Thiotrichaceae bacterium]